MKFIPFLLLFYITRKVLYILSKKIKKSNLTDETYYRISQRSYNYDYLRKN